MMLRSVAIGTALVALFLAGCVDPAADTATPVPVKAVASDKAAVCVGELTHSVTDGPEDFGAGVVTERTTSFSFDVYATTRRVEDCATGKTAYVGLRLSEDNHDFEPKFDAAVAALDPSLVGVDRLTAIVATARRVGADVTEDQSDKQSCACKVYYPRLKGDKKRYDPEQGL
ncbi:hypothetical protein ACTTAL_07855 [Rhodobacter capsulatus]|uniref:hypothetical protein n=1 Tax=Rhodobacter capsulatus TaxID=1061 RepID=UPI0003D323E0|nr:hypothetical protein [Rhodobacter capsulatus]ETD91249.1 hypothetical protein U713_03085 [Rhodobacter capsulatus YW2]